MKKVKKQTTNLLNNFLNQNFYYHGVDVDCKKNRMWRKFL